MPGQTWLFCHIFRDLKGHESFDTFALTVCRVWAYLTKCGRSRVRCWRRDYL